MPLFDENRDDLNAYFKSFEVVAEGQDWPKDKWATALSTRLAGEALKVNGRLSSTGPLDYGKMKKALLQRIRLTADGYHEKFRSCRPEDLETCSQFAVCLQSYFD